MVTLVNELQRKMEWDFLKVPRIITIYRHAMLEDDTKFHCVHPVLFIGPRQGKDNNFFHETNFDVPKQEVLSFFDDVFGRFTVVEVTDSKSKEKFWLVASENSRNGFVVPFAEHTREELQKKFYPEKAIEKQKMIPEPV